jgi:hypothetical protein
MNETNVEKLQRIKKETETLWKVSPNFQWLIEQAEEFERYKKYVMYFAGKDKVNDIRLAMQDRELD